MASRRSPGPSRAKPVATAATAARPPPVAKTAAAAVVHAAVTREARHAMIAEKAYLRAEGRGFAPGREAQDWLEAEAEVDALLGVSHGGSSQ